MAPRCRVSSRAKRSPGARLGHEHLLCLLEVGKCLAVHHLLQVGLVGHAQHGCGAFDHRDLASAPAQGHAAGRELAVRFRLQAGDELGDVGLFRDALVDDLHVECVLCVLSLRH